jgi:hypothetical protein
MEEGIGEDAIDWKRGEHTHTEKEIRQSESSEMDSSDAPPCFPLLSPPSPLPLRLTLILINDRRHAQ